MVRVIRGKYSYFSDISGSYLFVLVRGKNLKKFQI